MTRLRWVRHAPIAQTGCYTGQRDVEALLPAERPRHEDAALCFTSPLKRATQTAHWLFPDAPWQVTPALMEQHFGAWEGRSYDDVWKEAEHAHDWSKPESVRPPKGESFVDICERVEAWLKTILPLQQDVLIVAHAGTIRAAIRHAKNLSHAEALSLNLDYLSVTETRY